MKVLILGHGDHGKDTFAQYLVEHSGLSFISSSEFALDRAVWPRLNQFYRCKQHCFNDRKWHRDLWRDLISQYNSPDKGRLCKEMLVDHDVYVGMRARDEYDVVRDLFYFIFYVFDPRKPLESSMEIAFDPRHMIHVMNDSDKQSLKLKAIHYSNLLGLHASS